MSSTCGTALNYANHPGHLDQGHLDDLCSIELCHMLLASMALVLRDAASCQQSTHKILHTIYSAACQCLSVSANVRTHLDPAVTLAADFMSQKAADTQMPFSLCYSAGSTLATAIPVCRLKHYSCLICFSAGNSQLLT